MRWTAVDMDQIALLYCALFRSDAQSAGTIEDWLVGLLVVWFADIKKAQAYGLSFM